MSASHILIAIHVVLAVFIIGPMGLLPHTGLRAMRKGDPKQVRSIARSVNIYSLLSLLVFVLGFAAEGAAHISFGHLWVWLSVVLYAGAFVLSYLVVVPSMKRGAEELERDSTVKKPASYGAVAATAGVTTILLVVVVILMAFRP